MNAYLLLANGMVFTGKSVGAAGTAVGEVCFSTGTVGFQEGLTDPASYGALINHTYPMVGNYGMNDEDMESDKVWAAGLIARQVCTTPSNFRCQYSAVDFMNAHGVVGIEGIDTRHLTRVLREEGTMKGVITTEYDPAVDADKAALLEMLNAFTGAGAVAQVTAKEAAVYNEAGAPHIAVLDLGTKRNTVRCLVKRGCKVTVLPAFTPAEEILALAADGVLFSAGPGEPGEIPAVVQAAKVVLNSGLPCFGIGLGHLVVAAAAGLPIFKMKHGHHGANQPVTDLESGRTFITAQGHGYAVVSEAMPASLGVVAQKNANDGTCEGIRYNSWNCFTVQFNPEANGGPKETEFFFDRFLNNVKTAKEAN